MNDMIVQQARKVVKLDADLDCDGGGQAFDAVYTQRVLSADYNAKLTELRQYLDRRGVNGKAIVATLRGRYSAEMIRSAFDVAAARYSLATTAYRLLNGQLDATQTVAGKES